jgi:hypothetical protein
MKTYRVTMKRSYELYIEIKAESPEDAEEEAQDTDITEWEESDWGWDDEITSVEEVDE